MQNFIIHVIRFLTLNLNTPITRIWEQVKLVIKILKRACNVLRTS